MHRFLRFRKDEAAAALLEFSLLLSLIMVAAIGTVFLVERLAGGQAGAFNAIFQ